MRIGYAAAIANDFDRDEEARLQVCWAHHRLCLGAGSRHRQRPSRALLSAQCAQLSQRHNGVDIGKKDFLGPIRWVDA